MNSMTVMMKWSTKGLSSILKKGLVLKWAQKLTNSLRKTNRLEMKEEKNSWQSLQERRKN